MSEQFDEQGNKFETDDVEAHRQGLVSDLGEDTEGHRAAMDKAGLEVDDDDDVAGHRAAMDKAGWAADKAGLELDDVEGHLVRQIEVDDDVVGKQGLHVQPPRDADNQGNQF